MDNFETTLIINKIKSQKYGKDLIKTIFSMKNWYDTNTSNKNISHTLLCNVYKCFTLAISRYIVKCSSPLPMYIYEIKHLMEQKILSEEFLNTDKLTYEWLIDTFQYAANIPVDTPNSIYTQESGKQIGVKHNLNYILFNKLALIIKDKTIPFTIDFNSIIVGYYEYMMPHIEERYRYTMIRVIFIQTLKNNADNNIKYTLFEEAIDKGLKQLLAFKTSIKLTDFTEIVNLLCETIQAIKVLNLKYIKYLKIKDNYDDIKNTL